MLSPSWILPGLIVGLAILFIESLGSYLLVPITLILMREMALRSRAIAPFNAQAGVAYLLGVLAPVTVTLFIPMPQA